MWLGASVASLLGPVFKVSFKTFVNAYSAFDSFKNKLFKINSKFMRATEIDKY